MNDRQTEMAKALVELLRERARLEPWTNSGHAENRRWHDMANRLEAATRTPAQPNARAGRGQLMEPMTPERRRGWPRQAAWALLSAIRDTASGEAAPGMVDARAGDLRMALEVTEEDAENIPENAKSPALDTEAIVLARRLVDLLGRCTLYGPADALRDTAARLLTLLVDAETSR